MSVKKLSFCGISVALAAVTAMLKLFSFPFGGSVTFFSMLFVVLPAWFYGIGAGTVCGLVLGLIQFALDPYVISIPQFLLDYLLAFSVMGIAGLFQKSPHGLLKGYLVAVLCRWIIATLAGLAWVAAGFTAWENWSPIPYSMVYNGAYIFSEAALTVLLLCMPPIQKTLNYARGQATAD